MNSTTDQSGLPPSSAQISFIHRAVGPNATLREIAGDASVRRFFRVTNAGRTSILMIHGEALGENAPLYSNHRILMEIGAPVPRILARDNPLGLVLVEDFGDVSLQRHARGGGPTVPLYCQACDLIALMQSRGAGALRSDDFAARNALDRERFLFEMDHFQRHYILGLRHRQPTPAEAQIVQCFSADLAERCDRLPRVYCHRDFQSRNLMVYGGGLGLIDFQDARMGPYTYDAASLLRDSSLDLDQGLVEEMLERLARSCAAPLAIGPEQFREEFALMALQRNLKDLGTFGYMATVRGRQEYLEFVPRTVASVRSTLLRDLTYHDVYPVLAQLILD